MKNMTYTYYHPRAANNNHVVIMRPHDMQHFDATALRLLFRERDRVSVHLVISRALSGIAVRMDRLRRAHDNCNFDDMKTAASRIIAVSEQLGLIDVTKAARHTITCLRQNDTIALAANLARLQRDFDSSTKKLWQVCAKFSS